MSHRILWTGLLLALTLDGAEAAPFQSRSKAPPALTVTSPNGAFVVTLGTGDHLTWSVTARGQVILRPSRIAMSLTGGPTLGVKPVVLSSSPRQVRQILRPVVRIKRAEVTDRFNESRFDFAGNYSLIVRAYDDGVAYRWATRLAGEITVVDEVATFAFSGDHQLYFPEEASFISHQERRYLKPKISELKPGQFSGLPALAIVPGVAKVAITEADLLDYPGMDLTTGDEPRALRGLFPAYPVKTELDQDRTEKVLERAGFIARTRGTRQFPWRVLVIAERDATLLDSDIVYRLASETTMTDTSWIKPGKVAWDWWNFNNVFGVPFRAGVNTETYKHHIDFAAENGLQYVILDEGWYKLGDLLAVVPEVDMEAIAAHARARGVGLIMWVVWKTFDLQMDAALDQFAKWGVAGIKVDFMQREDQWMVNYYERVAKAAATRRLLVDFHGAYKPTGLYRTYPHVLTSEGVLGLEQSKWSDLASPDNAVTFPFLRMLAGPVDYTPGAMLNAAKADFKPVFNRPMSQGTRCQQLAMYVAYESPLQMLADTPSNYRREPESLAFLSKVPVVWDETRILTAAIGEHILVARRSGPDWYVGALTNWDARDLDVDLSFLGPGTFEADTYRDGPNADRVGVDYVREKSSVSAGDRLRIHLAPGGGWVSRMSPSRPTPKPYVAPAVTTSGAAVEQTSPGTKPGPELIESFEGLGLGFSGPQGTAQVRNPSDNSLAVGPDHIVQTVNGAGMAVFTRKGKRFEATGRVLYGPVRANNVFKGFGGNCEARNSGDVVVRYDQLADRWLIVLPLFSRGPARPDQIAPAPPGLAQLSVPGVAGQPGPAALLYQPPPPTPTPAPTPQSSPTPRPSPPPGPLGPYSMCYAISAGPDPLGPYYRYEFLRPLFPDYPRPAVWIDGYYVPTSTSDDRISPAVATEKHACVVDRAKMLKGQPATEQCVIIHDVNFLNNADIDGQALPPKGAPNIMMAAGGRQLDNILEDDVINVWQFHVDWKDPKRTRVEGPQAIKVAPYHYLCGGQLTYCVPQPGSELRLDAQGDKLMARLVYRRVNGHESVVAAHSIDTAKGGGGVRWYEFRVDDAKDRSRRMSLHQQGTYAPDGFYRWLPSPAIDKHGNIGIGYSFGGSPNFAGQRFAGRQPNDPPGQLTLRETVLVEGEAADGGPGAGRPRVQRWEDYTQTAVDPVDDCTIWYVGDYVRKDAVSYSSRIGAFRLPGCSKTPDAGSVASSPAR